MSNKFGLFGLLALGGAVVAAACSSSSSDDSAGKGGSGGSSGSSAGTAGKGGSSGHAGTTSHAGSSGKAGSTSSTAGTSSGDTSSQGGAGAGGDDTPMGEAGAPQCANPACKSGLCFPDGTCVDCLPSDDRCPSGTVCGSTNTCVPGCKADGTSCASGVCADAHDCQNCIDDTECGNGDLCGDNKCAPACTVAQEGTADGCGTGLTCCGLHCIAKETDSNNCGACGHACGTGQFCGISACAAGPDAGPDAGNDGVCVACHDVTIANVCSLPQVAVVLDGQTGNETPGRAMAAAMAAKCVPAPTVREVLQTVPDALNPASGRPVSGAHELLVAAGGSFYARLLGYVDDNHISPVEFVFDQATTTLKFVNAATGEVLISRPQSEAPDSHDYFVLQLMRDPITGSLVLNAEGFWLQGTNAASYFFQNNVLTNLSSFDKAWYVYDWTDKNGDMLPDSDEMTVVKAAD